MANGMLLYLGLPHRGMGSGLLLLDRGMGRGPLLSGGGSGRTRCSGWHHGRTMVTLGQDRSNKNATQ